MEAEITAKMDNITTMKKQVEKLDELAEMQEMFGEGEIDPAQMIGDDGQPMKIKPQKKQMCKKFMDTGKCKDIKGGVCKFAHNPIELSLIPVSTKIKNLNGVIQAQQHQLKHSQTAEGWIPAGI